MRPFHSSSKRWPRIIQFSRERRQLFGTDLDLVQEGIPAVIPFEMYYLGWQESLLALVDLAKPDTPDEG
jgi:hypothetical protein